MNNENFINCSQKDEMKFRFLDTWKGYLFVFTNSNFVTHSFHVLGCTFDCIWLT